MLSPIAINDVIPDTSRGGAVTRTEKLQDDATAFESTALHVTIVVPTENSESLPGVQVTWTGGVPPFDVTEPYRTDTGRPFGDVCDTSAGHVSFNGSGVGTGVGVAGLPHAAAVAATVASRRMRGRLKGSPSSYHEGI
jgi:hypothetical protein